MTATAARVKPTRTVIEDHCHYCQTRRPHSAVENGLSISYRCLRCSRRRRVTLSPPPRL